jgi:hypothetical protein
MSSETVETFETVDLSRKRATVHWIQQIERQLGLIRGNTKRKALDELGCDEKSLYALPRRVWQHGLSALVVAL